MLDGGQMSTDLIEVAENLKILVLHLEKKRKKF